MGWSIHDLNVSKPLAEHQKNLTENGPSFGGGGIPGLGGVTDLLNPYNEFSAGHISPGAEMKESRTRQAGQLDSLQAAAEGRGPSAAQQMVQDERSKNVNTALATAKAMPGAGYGAQQSMANQGAATANAGAATAGAQLRAQEQQKGMELYASALDAYRRGDIDTYKAYAQAYADSQKANAQVAAENAAAKRGIISGVVGGVTGAIGI